MRDAQLIIKLNNKKQRIQLLRSADMGLKM